MKKSFGLVKVFFIGVLAISLFGLLSFVVAFGHNTPNPGHAGSEICDSLFCVVPGIGLQNNKIGIGTVVPATLLTVVGNYWTISDDFLELRGGSNSPQIRLFFTRENLGATGGSWVIRTNQNNGLPLKIGTTHQGVSNKLDLELSNDLIFSDGSRQNTAAPGNCVTITATGGGNSITATCLAGSTLTGGGCKIDPWTVGSSYPTNDGTGWVCAGGNSWSTRKAYAICCS